MVAEHDILLGELLGGKANSHYSLDISTPLVHPPTETSCNSLEASCFPASKLVAMLSWLREIVVPESSINSTSLLPTIPLSTAALDRTAAVTTFTTLGGPIVFWDAPGQCRASPYLFPDSHSRARCPGWRVSVPQTA